MAVFLNPTDVVCEVDELIVRDDGEATGGAEPYLWSVFFKIDGDTMTAKLTIDNLSASLKLEGEGMVISPDQGSHGNLNLPDGEVKAGGLLEPTKNVVTIPREVGQFETNLKPIPLDLSFEPGSWLAETIDDAVLSVQNLIDWLAQDQGCPDLHPNQLLAQFGAEFVSDVIGGLPGTFGSLYILMEEDQLSKTAAETGRRKLRERLGEELKTKIIPNISLNQQEPGRLTKEAIEIRIGNAVQKAVLDAIEPWELLSFLDPDDRLGQVQVQMSHLQIAFAEEQEIDKRFRPSGNGDWQLSGRIGPKH